MSGSEKLKGKARNKAHVADNYRGEKGRKIKKPRGCKRQEPLGQNPRKTKRPRWQGGGVRIKRTEKIVKKKQHRGVEAILPPANCVNDDTMGGELTPKSREKAGVA